MPRLDPAGWDGRSVWAVMGGVHGFGTGVGWSFSFTFLACNFFRPSLLQSSASERRASVLPSTAFSRNAGTRWPKSSRSRYVATSTLLQAVTGTWLARAWLLDGGVLMALGLWPVSVVKRVPRCCGPPGNLPSAGFAGFCLPGFWHASVIKCVPRCGGPPGNLPSAGFAGYCLPGFWHASVINCVPRCCGPAGHLLPAV